MDVQIGELSSTVRAVDSESVLAPQTMSRIIKAVMAALEEERRHEERVRAERRVTPGVAAEQSEDE